MEISWKLWLIIVVVIILLIYIISLIFKKKPATKESKDDSSVAAKQEEIKKINTSRIKISIYRPLSDSLYALAGEPFYADEKRDNNNNLLVINDQKNFKEDFNFSIDRIYEVMNFSLELGNKTKKEKEAIINAKIKTQEELLCSIDNDVNLNKEYNYPDEEVKLRQLKVYRESLKKETVGNYMRLAEGGIRHYEFVSIDGVLYPYFFGGRIYRVYPDLLVKKKIFNHENTVFRNETAALQKSIFNWMMIIVLVIGLISIAIGIGTGMYYNKKTSEITIMANNGAITCENTLARMQQQYGDTVSSYWKAQENENIKKVEEHNINSNVPDVNNIIIDPTKLNK